MDNCIGCGKRASLCAFTKKCFSCRKVKCPGCGKVFTPVRFNNTGKCSKCLKSRQKLVHNVSSGALA